MVASYGDHDCQDLVEMQRTEADRRISVLVGIEAYSTKCGVITDGKLEYRPLKNMGRRHYLVKHSDNEYVKDVQIDGEVVQITTNRMEAFWPMIRRAQGRVPQDVSQKHVQRYFDEIAGCRNVCRKDTIEIMEWIANRLFGQNLTYKQLTTGYLLTPIMVVRRKNGDEKKMSLEELSILAWTRSWQGRK